MGKMDQIGMKRGKIEERRFWESLGEKSKKMGEKQKNIKHTVSNKHESTGWLFPKNNKRKVCGY